MKKKYWVEFQYNIRGLPDNIELRGFSSLPYEMELSSKAIVKLKQFIADKISEKALTARGIDVGHLRKEHYKNMKALDIPFCPDYDIEKDWGIKAEEINLTLVLELI